MKQTDPKVMVMQNLRSFGWSVTKIAGVMEVERAQVHYFTRGVPSIPVDEIITLAENYRREAILGCNNVLENVI